MKKSAPKIALAVLLVGALFAFFYFDVQQFLSFSYIKSQQAAFSEYYTNHQALTIGLFFIVYVAVTGLSLPGAAILTLVAGALFGLTVGTLIVSFASSIGATLAFLVSRFLLQDLVQSRFSSQLSKLNAGIEKEGWLYLFTLRLVPIVPFFVINLVMGVTPIRTSVFYLTSQVGMLAGTIVYVNAGTQLASLESTAGILSPKLIVSFVLLGLFPILAKKLVTLLPTKKKGLS